MVLDTKQSGVGGGEWHIITPEEEIRALEAKLAEKKREHEAAGATTPAEEKKIFREVMGEHIAENRATVAAPADETHIAPATAGNGVPSTAVDAAAAATREQKLAALVEYALTHTIEAAVDKAEKETPYLIDELHDRLADQYYDKLVQLRKLEAL
ncbi:MAG: hypothetical protein WAP52_03500 [Candidatus Sungiibacteriota bacterium]